MAEATGKADLRQTIVADSDATFDYTCQPCSGDRKTLEAVGFCVDCSELLCDECFRYHLKPPLTRHHKLLDIEEAKKDTNISGCLDICTKTCSEHRGKVIEYYCVDHSCLGCGVCITIDHRNCQGVKYIPKVAEEAGNGEDFSNLIRQLDMVLLQTEILTDTSRSNQIRSQDNFDKVLDHVKRIRKDVNNALDKLEKEIETEALKMKSRDIQKLEENIKSCDTLHSETDILTSKLKGMKQKGQYCNLYVAVKSSKTEMKSLFQRLDDISRGISASDYILQPSKELVTFLKNSESLAQICQTGVIKTNVVKMGEVIVRMPSDRETCSVRGLAMVKRDRLVAADYSNKTLKLIELKQYKIISEYHVSCRPCDITATDENGEIAVTTTDQCEILLLRLKDDVLYTHMEIKTSGSCYGVACIKDKLVVTLTSPERIEIIDKLGNILHTIMKDEEGQHVFHNVCSVTVNQLTGTIYVPDYGKAALTRLSLSGQVQGIYKDSELKGASCVAVDKPGTVYAGGELSNNIHQITSHNKKISILLTKKDGLNVPRSLCYDENTDVLYVGQLSDKILIYQLNTVGTSFY